MAVNLGIKTHGRKQKLRQFDPWRALPQTVKWAKDGGGGKRSRQSPYPGQVPMAGRRRLRGGAGRPVRVRPGAASFLSPMLVPSVDGPELSRLRRVAGGACAVARGRGSGVAPQPFVRVILTGAGGILFAPVVPASERALRPTPARAADLALGRSGGAGDFRHPAEPAGTGLCLDVTLKNNRQPNR